MYRILTTEEKSEWDILVKQFTDYDIYYLSGYVCAFEQNGDGIATLFYYEKDETKAINIFMKRDISFSEVWKGKLERGKYFDIATPYGYGGFLIEGPDIEGVQKEFQYYCQKEHIVSEFVRFHPMLENWLGLGAYYTTNCAGNTVYMDIQNETTIWNNLTTKNRNMIRKAKKSGLRTYWGRDEAIIQEFMEIYNETMRKDQAADYYYFDRKFYESILEDIPNNALWFYVKLEEKIVAISIFIMANGKMNYHLSASRKEYQKFAPTNLLLYDAAVWGSQNGCQTLHLGGGLGAQSDSLYKFKKSFNRNEDKQFWTGKRIFDKDTYDYLMEMRTQLEDISNKNDYFPEYRK